jgi:hypothetical protein
MTARRSDTPRELEGKLRSERRGATTGDPLDCMRDTCTGRVCISSDEVSPIVIEVKYNREDGGGEEGTKEREGREEILTPR